MFLPLLLLFSPQAIRLEAENATLFGPHVANARPGFSGSGYVTDITGPNARIIWHLKAKAGIYAVRIGYSAASEKGFDLGVNGFKSSGMLSPTGDKFGVTDVGKVELRSGDNEISVERGWGYYDVDYIDLIPAALPATIKPLYSRLCDAKATPETRKLFSRLLKGYGRVTLSGQYDESECAYVFQQTKQMPAILGADLMDYSPSRQPYFNPPPSDSVPSWIRAALAGQILTLSWHWNAPADLLNEPNHKTPEGKTEDDSWYRGFYTNASRFDVQRALSDKNSKDYKLILRDIDAIAIQLKRLQAARIPILWRPLHEAEGGWFWWGAKGPEACKMLYRLMFDRLTRVHGIHNLIWVWNSGNPAWYPGDDVVDIMSIDNYPSDRRDALSNDWEQQLDRFNGRKPLALAEFPGAPDVERMRRFGVRWLYFVSWTGGVGPKSTEPAILRSTYRSPLVVNANLK